VIGLRLDVRAPHIDLLAQYFDVLGRCIDILRRVEWIAAKAGRGFAFAEDLLEADLLARKCQTL
jgi:hypothetical protein